MVGTVVIIIYNQYLVFYISPVRHVNSWKTGGIADCVIRQSHCLPHKYKCPCAKGWQDGGVFIFWLFARSLVGLLLPNSFSQIQVGLRRGCSRGCLSGGKEATSIMKTKEVALSKQNDGGSVFPAVISQCRILALCPCRQTERPPLFLKHWSPQLLIK